MKRTRPSTPWQPRKARNVLDTVDTPVSAPVPVRVPLVSQITNKGRPVRSAFTKRACRHLLLTHILNFFKRHNFPIEP